MHLVLSTQRYIIHLTISTFQFHKNVLFLLYILLSRMTKSEKHEITRTVKMYFCSKTLFQKITILYFTYGNLRKNKSGWFYTLLFKINNYII